MTRSAHRSDNPVLTLANITKRFGRTLALEDVSLLLRPGSVHALLGENGAGKTTLMRIAFGTTRPDSGRVTAAGFERPIRSPGDAAAAGIGMVHQHFSNVGAMTVAENVALGRSGRFDAAAAVQRVREIGARTGLTLDPEARAEDLAVGAQQRLEILKALARDARVLILDEPTAVLAPAEADQLLAWLRGYADAGHSVVLITHKLREALAIADDVTVLRRGRIALNAPSTQVTAEVLTAAMIGEALPGRVGVPTDSSVGPVVARAQAIGIVSGRGAWAIREASFEIRAGEIVGIAGVEGAGQRELLRALASRQPIASGELMLPAQVGFVPEDRHRDALVLDYDASENIGLKAVGRQRGRMRWRNLRSHAATLIQDFDVRGATPRTPVKQLSGGNQQKLVLARELDGAPPLLVVENPTRGLDIRATRDVQERLAAAATAGTAVVIYSSDLDEVLAVATRVLAVHAGAVVETPLEREAVGRAMLGVR